MKYEQEIIDMENYYATATPEEAIAYFKAKSAQAFSSFRSACKKAIAICDRIVGICNKVASKCRGIMARFGKYTAGVRRDIALAKVMMDTDINTEGFTDATLDELEDRYNMELLLIEAKEILLKSKTK
jgi:hypothetical protein